MAEPSPGVWQALRSLFQHRARDVSLRESLEEAIEEHQEAQAHADDLDADEREMLMNMLAAGERTAADIATPRSEIEALPEAASFEEAVACFSRSGHTRVPLYRATLDEVVGMLHLKDIFLVLAGHAPRPDRLATLMRPVLFVPPGKPAFDLLTEMRKDRTHMAIVVDEFGGTDGLVTIEDIVEEVVGEIEDEHDEAEADLVRPVAGNGFEAEARVALEDLEERLATSFTDADLADEVETLGGLAVLLAGRVPVPGETFVHPNGWRLEITAGDDRRVERLILHPPEGLPAANA